jgi:hypothetical protein
MPKGMQPIYTVNLGTAAGYFYFNNIPQNYTDLKVVFSYKSNSTTDTGSYIVTQYNGDTNTNYSYTMVYQAISDYGTSVISGRGSNETYHAYSRFATSTTASWGANTFTTFEIDYPNYSSIRFKQVLAQVSAPSTGTNYSSTQYAQLWRNNSPITSMIFSSPVVFAAGSTATLYGISR